MIKATSKITSETMKNHICKKRKKTILGAGKMLIKYLDKYFKVNHQYSNGLFKGFSCCSSIHILKTDSYFLGFWRWFSTL